MDRIVRAVPWFLALAVVGTAALVDLAFREARRTLPRVRDGTALEVTGEELVGAYGSRSADETLVLANDGTYRWSTETYPFRIEEAGLWQLSDGTLRLSPKREGAMGHTRRVVSCLDGMGLADGGSESLLIRR